MMDVKPFAESADVNEEVVRNLVIQYGSLTVIRAICGLLKTDLEKRVIDRENWLRDSCKALTNRPG